jgi:hypothetical protein
LSCWVRWQEKIEGMNRQPFEKPPRWWSPKLSRRWVNFWRPVREREQRRKHRLLKVEVRGAEHVRDLLDGGFGVLVTPNHCSHADCFALYAAADRVGRPCYAMMAWQVFARGNWLRRQLLRWHGAFSVDREGTDLAALRQAREILQSGPYPLAIFPEGEVYHLNERLTPFREGPAAIALMAIKKSTRPIACVPCAIRYSYVRDPTPELLELMGRLESSLHWRPRPDLSLPQRIYHLAEGVLALKEVEILGASGSGPIPERIGRLIEFLLGRIECRHQLAATSLTVPERVKAARQHVISKLEAAPPDAAERPALIEDLDDLFLAVQAFSYPGDYVAERPSIERIAETLDKFEEDLLGVPTATIRGARQAIVVFGEPIVLQPGSRPDPTARQLTQTLQDRVAGLLQASE